jgi:acyl-CoA thioester hydrolase
MTADAATGGEVFTTRVALRWADMDALGHLNNATSLSLLEEARLQFLLRGDSTGERLTGILAARHEIDYVIPVFYSQQPVSVRMWIDRIGRTSFTLGAEVHDQAGALAIRCRTVMVCIAGDGSGPAPIPDDWRTELSDYLAAAKPGSG